MIYAVKSQNMRETWLEGKSITCFSCSLFWYTMREHYQTQRSSLSVSQFFSNINRLTLLYTSIYLSDTVLPVQCSVADRDPNPDPYVFGPPGY